ncbi:MAG TPA: type II toxin-antitoxin system HicA family toxin [Isosphaeraceae bacterium]
MRLLADDGWYKVGQKGSHRQFRHDTKIGNVTVAGPPSADVPPETLKSISLQAGLEESR